MSRLPLGQVTLCAVDTRAPALAAQALLRSMEHVDFGRVFLFTHDWLPAVVLPGIEIVDIEPIRSGAEYSHFVLRLLPGYIRTSHVLVTQWDGFVVHPEAWTDEFLVYDYVGAVWPDEPDDCNVGNGGFSLRSRRLLLAGQDMRIKQEHPEDVVLCRTHRDFLEQVHGVRFAPARLARRFSVENELAMGISFGFSGAKHLPRFFDESLMLEWVDHLPEGFVVSAEGSHLARALMLRGMPNALRRLLIRRQTGGQTAAYLPAMSAAASLIGMVSPRT